MSGISGIDPNPAPKRKRGGSKKKPGISKTRAAQLEVLRKREEKRISRQAGFNSQLFKYENSTTKKSVDKELRTALTKSIEISKVNIANKQFQKDLKELMKTSTDKYENKKQNFRDIEILFITVVMEYLNKSLEIQKKYGWNGNEKLILDINNEKHRDFFTGSLKFNSNNPDDTGLADGTIRDLRDFNKFIDGTKEIKEILDLVVWDTKYWKDTKGDLLTKNAFLKNILRYNDLYYITFLRTGNKKHEPENYKLRSITEFNWNRLDFETFEGMNMEGDTNTIKINHVKKLIQPQSSIDIFNNTKNKISSKNKAKLIKQHKLERVEEQTELLGKKLSTQKSISTIQGQQFSSAFDEKEFLRSQVSTLMNEASRKKDQRQILMANQMANGGVIDEAFLDRYNRISDESGSISIEAPLENLTIEAPEEKQLSLFDRINDNISSQSLKEIGHNLGIRGARRLRLTLGTNRKELINNIIEIQKQNTNDEDEIFDLLSKF